MNKKAHWVRIVTVLITVAAFYASACSATCLVGVCPNQVQQTSGHDCDQSPSHHSHPSGHQMPDKSECSQHQHPTLFLAKSGNLSTFQLSTAAHFPASVTALDSGLDLILSAYSVEASDIAPPLGSSTPLYQKISVLRI